PRDELPDPGAVPPDEARSRLAPAVPRIGGKQPLQIAVVGLRRREGVERLLFLVVLANGLAQLVQRIETLARHVWRPLACDLAHQLVDIFELLQRRPAGIARPPVRTRPQPHREGFGEILVGVALRVPEPEMLDVTPAGGIGPVVARIAFRRRAEQPLPTPATLQLIGVLDGVSRLVPENGHALGPGTALDVEHHFLFELHQAGMGEIKRDGNAGHIRRTEPFVRDPYMRPQPNAALFELLIESADAILEPGAFDRDPQAAEAPLEQLLIRQLFPSIFLPAGHGNLEVMTTRDLHGVMGCRRRQPPKPRGLPPSGGSGLSVSGPLSCR